MPIIYNMDPMGYEMNETCVYDLIKNAFVDSLDPFQSRKEATITASWEDSTKTRTKICDLKSFKMIFVH